MHKMLVDEAQRRASYWFDAEADERIVMTLWDASGPAVAVHSTDKGTDEPKPQE